MKRTGVLVLLAAVIMAGCSGVTTKRVKVFTEPSDAVIRVVSGKDLKEVKYRPPATLSLDVPTDPALAAKAVLEVQKENYKSRTIALSDVRDGETLNIKLEKVLRDIVRYRLSYRLVTPSISPEMQYRDKVISISFAVGELAFQVRFENVSNRDLKILWERCQYTDVSGKLHRIIHGGVRHQDRNNPMSDQIVVSRSSMQTNIAPVTNVSFSQEKKVYEVRPLFNLDSDAAASLKGASFSLFLPVEIDRQIVPYTFRFEITDSVKETIKG